MSLKPLPPTGDFIPLIPVGPEPTPGAPPHGTSLRSEVVTGHWLTEPERSPDMLRIARLSFDLIWEAELTATGLQVTIHPLRDFSEEFGLPPGALMPLTYERWFSLAHPEDRPGILNAMQEAVRTSGNYSVHYRAIHADGSILWWEGAGGPVRFHGGRAVRWLGGARNVTERKREEDRLRHALAEAEAMRSRLEVEVTFLREEADLGSPLSGIIGRSPSLQRVLRQAELVAATESTVLLTGETGTGKGLLARAIHQRSRRGTRRLVTVNCAALPASLIESELFGHQKGAFTGATTHRPGRFEFAEGGSIFLDEIGELPLDLQAKLLRVLETGEFERVGSTETRKANVRVIAATNRDLAALARENRFRRDLYYRLQVFPIEIPPLRERPEDIPLLVAYILEKKCADLGHPLMLVSPDQMQMLARYRWPGNIRELENVIERAIILAAGSDMSLDFTSLQTIDQGLPPPPPLPSPEGGNAPTLDAVERAHILAVCASTNWKIKGKDGAAARLGLTPSTLYFRMKKHGIGRPAARDAPPGDTPAPHGGA